MTTDLRPVLDFLRDLRANNHRDWFEAHRAQYDQARDAFTGFVQTLITRFDAVDDLGALTPDQAIYRLNRDVRFSNDKTPYKTNMSALLGKDGKRTMLGRAYYIQVGPDDQSLVASGLHVTPRPIISAVRAAIAEDATPLRSILASDSFRTHFGALGGDTLKSAPKGYAKDHPAIDLLRHNTFEANVTLTDEEVTSPQLVERVLALCAAARPFTDYFVQVLTAAKIDMAEVEASFRR